MKTIGSIEDHSMKSFVFTESSTLDDIEEFLYTLDCPNFTYSDVLSCYSDMIAQTWVIPERASQNRKSNSQKIRKNENKGIFESESDSSIVGDEDEEISDEIETPPQLDTCVARRSVKKGSVKSAKGRVPPKERIKGAKWTKAETDALFHGIRKFGWGHWKEILLNEPLLSETMTYRQVLERAKWLKRAGKMDVLFKELGIQP